MTLEELRQHEDYKLLTDQQRSWLECYLLSDEPEECTRKHYGAQEGLSLKNLTKKNLANIRMKKLTNLFRGVSELDELLEIAWDVVRDDTAKPHVRLSAIETIARLRGFIKNGKPVTNTDDFTDILDDIKE